MRQNFGSELTYLQQEKYPGGQISVKPLRSEAQNLQYIIQIFYTHNLPSS
jgi:hypothetical protein